jgi:hypothetical protein
MISPSSYYGVEKHRGYLRITCSADLYKLQDLMDRLEVHLKQNRLKKQDRLKQGIEEQLELLKKVNPTTAVKLPLLTNTTNASTATALELKNENKNLQQHLLLIKRLINRVTPEGRVRAATLIQAAYRGHKARNTTIEINKNQDDEWFNFVERVSPQTNIGFNSYLKQLSVSERLEFELWKEHLREKESSVSANFFINAMSYSVLNPYVALLVFVGLTSGIVACLGLASMSAVGLAAASIVGVGTLTMGLSFFSQSIKTHFSRDYSLDKYSENIQPCMS